MFIETLLAILACKRLDTAEAILKVTHDQIRRVAAARFGVALPVWDNKQIARFKEKYVNRLGVKGGRKPATRFELLREVRKGQRASGSRKGTPSEYQTTGIEVLLRGTDARSRNRSGSREEPRHGGGRLRPGSLKRRSRPHNRHGGGHLPKRRLVRPVAGP